MIPINNLNLSIIYSLLNTNESLQKSEWPPVYQVAIRFYSIFNTA